MRLRTKCIVLLILVTSSFHLSGFSAQVVAISDGDTLTVLEDRQQLKIRLANIDAPEKAQPFGQKSKESLSDLCYRKDTSYQTQDVDKYGRMVAVVTCGGVEANREQVRRGFAWIYQKYNRDPSLLPLEQEAKENRALVEPETDRQSV